MELMRIVVARRTILLSWRSIDLAGDIQVEKDLGGITVGQIITEMLSLGLEQEDLPKQASALAEV
jgi:hypothetical protein